MDRPWITPNLAQTVPIIVQLPSQKLPSHLSHKLNIILLYMFLTKMVRRKEESNSDNHWTRIPQLAE